MGFDDEVVRNAGPPLEAIDVLSEEHTKQALIGEECDKSVGYSGMKPARIQLLGKNIERLGIRAEVIDVEDSLGKWEVERWRLWYSPVSGERKSGTAIVLASL